LGCTPTTLFAAPLTTPDTPDPATLLKRSDGYRNAWPSFVTKIKISNYETGLKSLEKTIAQGRLKDRNMMEQRLGKIQARHPSVNDLYEVALRDTSEGVRLFWQIKEGNQKWRESREGAYLLRTNLAQSSRSNPTAFQAVSFSSSP